jgi:isopenicillin N synthase-like dioxygenase
LYPESPKELGPCVDEWFSYMSLLGKALLRGVAIGLGMDENWFAENICKEPTELF